MGEGTTKNGKGAVAVMSVVTMAMFGWMLWQGQNASTQTLERLTNQRLGAMETTINRPIDRADNPIRHTEAINELQTQALRNDVRSDERRQELINELQTHRDVEGHPTVVTGLAAMQEKLVEVETQFRHLDRLIQLLWQRTYDEPLPNPPEK